MKFHEPDTGPQASFPPYAYIPGGPWPHPTRSPSGHSHNTPRPQASPIIDDDWQESHTYLHGVALFNAGFYWEAHEYWEALWHVHNRKGPTALVLQALIKLAAAGVKVREHQPHGVCRHAARAADHLAAARDMGQCHLLGLDLEEWIQIASSLAQSPPPDVADRSIRVARVFAFQILPQG